MVRELKMTLIAAAMMSAVDEGLAGVVDVGTGA